MPKKLYLCPMNIEPIAYFHSPLTSKFGIPRQAGIVRELRGQIVFEPAYRNTEALRGLEAFDYRPNNLGLSSVRIERIEDGVIHVLGADLMDGTPIYDIKPYLEYVDSHTGVRSGFVDERQWQELKVEMSEELQRQFTNDELQALMATLRQDPRPQYHDDPQRTYGMPFAGRDVRFRVEDGTLFVTHVEPVAP